ncbi:MAG TPA: hypothetical protein VGM88_16470 [Kofleriaceae bacterium]|jgi:hypothetical protein
MASFTGHVVNGRLVLDEPTDLPDGTKVELRAMDDLDELSEDQRAKLDAMIAESREQFARGEIFDEDEIRDELYGS